jgi:hypothetical protein
MNQRPDKIQWHPAFCGAAELEFRENRDDLEFNREYNLSKKPLEVDLLIIKKRADAEIVNEIGGIFRRFNILEYKSPRDGMSIDDYYKAVGYACLYKSLGTTVDAIPASELTVSLFRETYPREMMQALKKQGAIIKEKYPGIYYVTGNTLFVTQVVVTGQLRKETHCSLRILSENAQREDIRRFLDESEALNTPGDQHNSGAVLQASVAANASTYKNLKERKQMNKVVMEILWKEELDELKAEIAAKVTEETRAKVTEETRAKVTEETRAKVTEETRAKVTEETRAKVTEETRAKVTEETRAKVTEETRAKVTEETRAKVLSEGLTEGRAESIERLLRKGKSPEEIHDLLDYPMEEILRVEREVSAVK